MRHRGSRETHCRGGAEEQAGCKDYGADYTSHMRWYSKARNSDKRDRQKYRVGGRPDVYHSSRPTARCPAAACPRGGAVAPAAKTVIDICEYFTPQSAKSLRSPRVPPREKPIGMILGRVFFANG